MQKNTCSSIVLAWVILTATGCSFPFPRTLNSHADDTGSGDVQHIVAPGDRLSDIALQYTGNVGQWEAIANYNEVSDPKNLRIGDVIIIPASMVTARYQAASQSLRSKDVTSVAVSNSGAIESQRAQVKDTRKKEDEATSVAVNRSSQLERTDTLNVDDSSADSTAPLKVKVVGTYYPKGIYQQPVSYSRLMMRVAPGTVLELGSKINDWYKVFTSEGIGYLRLIDGRIIDDN